MNTHYYSKTQGDLESKPSQYTFNFKEHQFIFHTDAGVFSKDYIDYGSFAMLKIFKPNNLEYPIYHLDFETFPCPIPRFFGEKPYTQSCFEFSLHIEKEEGICDIEKDNYINTFHQLNLYQ